MKERRFHIQFYIVLKGRYHSLLRKIIAVCGSSIDSHYTPRYILVDETTGVIVVDAQG